MSCWDHERYLQLMKKCSRWSTGYENCWCWRKNRYYLWFEYGWIGRLAFPDKNLRFGQMGSFKVWRRELG